jgi:hypothetical protein
LEKLPPKVGDGSACRGKVSPFLWRKGEPCWVQADFRKAEAHQRKEPWRCQARRRQANLLRPADLWRYQDPAPFKEAFNLYERVWVLVE